MFLSRAMKSKVVSDILQQTCYNKLISVHVCMACDSFLATSLLQVVRLVAGWLSKLVIHRLAATTSRFNGFNKSANDKLQTCCNLIKLISSMQLVDKLKQAGKIDDLGQVCGVSQCVYALPETPQV